jgi:hypothetical protein
VDGERVDLTGRPFARMKTICPARRRRPVWSPFAGGGAIQTTSSGFFGILPIRAL